MPPLMYLAGKREIRESFINSDWPSDQATDHPAMDYNREETMVRHPVGRSVAVSETAPRSLGITLLLSFVDIVIKQVE